LNEGEFICEVIDPVTGEPANEGELVITNLGRVGMPVIRYRTGDQVKLQTEPCECGRTFLRLEGGVIGRIDDALIIRGVNVYPSTIENIIRRFAEVGEFAVDVYRQGALDEMEIRIQSSGTDPDMTAQAVAKAVRESLGLRVVVKPVPHGTLPSFELKARRFTDPRRN
jgi:phenylacetate-CoA ligase